MESSGLRIDIGNVSEVEAKTIVEASIRFTSQDVYEEKADLKALFADMPLPEEAFVAAFEVDPKYTEGIADVLNSKVINQEPSVFLPELFLLGHEEKKYQIYFLQNPSLSGKLFLLVIPESATKDINELKEHMKKTMGNLNQESFLEIYFQSSEALVDFSAKDSAKKVEAFFQNSGFGLNISNDKKIGNLLNAYAKRIKGESQVSQLLKNFHVMLNGLEEFTMEMKLKSPSELPEAIRNQWFSEQGVIGLADGLLTFLRSVFTPESKSQLLEFLNTIAASPDIKLSLLSQGLGSVDLNLRLPGLIDII